jgi:hypothetical protein
LTKRTARWDTATSEKIGTTTHGKKSRADTTCTQHAGLSLGTRYADDEGSVKHASMDLAIYI